MFTIIGVAAVVAFVSGGGIVWHRKYTGRWMWQPKLPPPGRG